MRKRIIENLTTLNKVFVHEADKNYTYQDLYEVVLKLNMYFRKNHISKVLISLPQGFIAYASIISCYITNVTFCSIHYEDPLSRKELYCSEFLPDLIITDQFKDFPENLCSFISTEDIVRMRTDTCELVRENDNNEIAYVIYTSGSTGLPKGVKIRDISFSKEIRWIWKTFGIKEEDVCSQYPKLNFDMSLIDIFVAVVAGASLVPFKTFSDKLFPVKLIQRHQISYWNSVPNVVDMLVTQNKMNAKYMKSIKKYKFGGEQIYSSQLEHVFECNSEADIFLSYGPSEVTLFCSCCHINIKNYKDYSKHNMSLGECIPGWNICLKDIKDEVGEIVVYGEYIGVGYIGNRDENKNFGTIALDGKEHKAYFTGDYGTYIDGHLYFCGRRDSQVKVNGNRIDMSEIERVLRENGCEATCTVYHGGKIFLFYISEDLSENDVSEIILRELPKTFFPHKICRRDIFPRNNSFKVDREELINSLKNER